MLSVTTVVERWHHVFPDEVGDCLQDDPTPGLDNPKPSTANSQIDTNGFGSNPKFDWGPYTRPAPATPSGNSIALNARPAF